MYLLSMCHPELSSQLQAIIHLKQNFLIIVYLPLCFGGSAAADLYIEQDRLIYFL